MSSITPSRGRQLDQNAVPTTSLADMMFLLLIFFIMTTTLTRTTGFVTDVAAGAKGQTTAATDKTPTVAMHDGKISVDDKPMSIEELRRHIADLHLDQKTGDGKVVIVSTAGNVTYQQYYEVMAAIRTSGGVAAIVSEETGTK